MAGGAVTPLIDGVAAEPGAASALPPTTAPLPNLELPDPQPGLSTIVWPRSMTTVKRSSTVPSGCSQVSV